MHVSVFSCSVQPVCCCLSVCSFCHSGYFPCALPEGSGSYDKNCHASRPLNAVPNPACQLAKILWPEKDEKRRVAGERPKSAWEALKVIQLFAACLFAICCHNSEVVAARFSRIWIWISGEAG